MERWFSTTTVKKQKDINPMFWVILCTFIAYIAVNIPLIYSLLFVHGRQGIAILWGYAPNQFLFLVLAFPFATLSTLIGLHILIVRLGPDIPPDYTVRVFFDNWLVSLLTGLIIASLITIAVYFSSAMSFDKLQPKYAQRAIEAVNLLEDRIESAKSDEREAIRQDFIRHSRKELETLEPPPLHDPAAFENWIDQLPPDVYLQVVQNPKLQLRLKLMNPTIHSLNIVQLFTAIFIAFCALVTAMFCIYAAREVSFATQGLSELSKANNALYFALFFFAFYPICYSQHRAEIERYIGTGSTVLQDVLTGVVILVVLILLRSSDPGSRDTSGFSFIYYTPIIMIVIGYVVQILSPQIMRQLIGSQTKFGIQLIFGIVCTLFSVFAIIQIWPRR